ncbi:hypothetical protein GCM10009565_19590 [Amycolatopsis albidoflavus]
MVVGEIAGFGELGVVEFEVRADDLTDLLHAFGDGCRHGGTPDSQGPVLGIGPKLAASGDTFLTPF